jgi:uncharacterized repeat protein (TIGR03803 family)
LVQGADGSFYGVTEYGGQYGAGTIFRLTIAPAFLSATKEGGVINFTWSTEVGTSYQLQYCTNLAEPNWICLGASMQAGAGALSASDMEFPDAQRFYRIVAAP